MKRKLMLLLGYFMLCTGLGFAQNKIVNGVVLSDSDGSPVIGATVQVKGITIGSSTDVEGKFVLDNIPQTATHLIISFIGMQTMEVTIQPTIKVLMKEDVKQMDEVIVVAFGKEKRSSFTGSAIVVSSEELAGRQVTNTVDAIAGKVAGVQMVYDNGAPEGTPPLRIRGFSSINAGQDPLIIVDGMPFDGGWNNINPADVASITVLKDAASNALYGARGANGIVMITTRSAGHGDAIVTLDAK